jgi:hypothetical protein
VYVPNIQSLLLEIETNESQLQAQKNEIACVLTRLGSLEVCDDTKAIFQRYLNRELTIKELRSAIDEYINLKAGSVHLPKSESL